VVKLEWKGRPLLRWDGDSNIGPAVYTAVRKIQRHQPFSVLDEEIDVEGHQEAECDDKYLATG
jgi:hypothetical protein